MIKKFVNVTSKERFKFQLIGNHCAITTQRKANSRWVDLPDPPHFARTFEGSEEPHEDYYGNFVKKFTTDESYREAYRVMQIRDEPEPEPQPELATAPAVEPQQVVDSLTIKCFDADGFDVLLCLRGNGELMPRGLKALAWLKEQGFAATREYTPLPQPVTNGPVATVPAMSTPAVCPYHGEMKPSKKFNGWYCTAKMGDGQYCREEVRL